MRTGSNVLDLAHARQPFTLLYNLLNRPLVAFGNNGHARPLWVEGLANREGFDIEAARAEESHNPGQLARLIGNYD